MTFVLIAPHKYSAAAAAAILLLLLQLGDIFRENSRKVITPTRYLP